MGSRATTWDWVRKTATRVLPRGRFARSVFMLAGGTALGQAITVLASPILTRLYTPEDFGVLAVYFSLLGVLSTVAALRYELAIPLPEKDEDAAALVVLSLVIVVGMILIVGVGVRLLGERLVLWTNVQALRAHLWLLPVGLGLVGSYQIFNYYAVRSHLFGAIARTKAWQGTFAVASQIGFGLLKLGTGGLLIGQIVGQAAGVLGLLSLSSLRLSWRTIRKVFILAGEYWRFPLLSSWSSILNAISIQFPLLLISGFFGTGVAGQYALGLRVVQTPMNMLGSAIGQVFFSGAAEACRAGDLPAQVQRVYERLVQVAIAAFLPLAVAAPELFTCVFGQAWREAGGYVQWLSPWFFFVLTGSPLSTLPLVLGRQAGELFFQATLLSVRILALSVGALFQNAVLGIALFSAVSTLWWGAYNFWILRLVGVRLHTVFHHQLLKFTVLLVFCALLILKGLAIKYVGNDVFVSLAAIAAGFLLLWAVQGKPK